MKNLPPFRFVYKLKPAFLFLSLITLTYTLLFFASDQLRWDVWVDETWFWETSQQFSQRLLPTLEQLRSYNELNTPLPFIIYGILEYLFHGGLFAGRLLNFCLSLVISFLIGWPGQGKNFRPIVALIGLFLFPYFLWLSARYYTDIIASFFGLLGVVLYVRKSHLLSSLSFVLAIASRQYLLAFPMAIATHELIVAIRQRQRPSLSFLLPCVAALSILGWVILFGGLAPSNAYLLRPAPDVQRNLWSLAPSSGLFFLASLGLAYVIPEWLLFYRRFDWKAIAHRQLWIIAAGLLGLFLLFPPELIAKGLLLRASNMFPGYGAKQIFFYGLALLTCWRFARVNLTFWLVAFNTLIMMKSFPWDRYALPLVVVLWYLQSKQLMEHPYGEPAQSKPEPETVNKAMA